MSLVRCAYEYRANLLPPTGLLKVIVLLPMQTVHLPISCCTGCTPGSWFLVPGSCIQYTEPSGRSENTAHSVISTDACKLWHIENIFLPNAAFHHLSEQSGRHYGVDVRNATGAGAPSDEDSAVCPRSYRSYSVFSA